MNTAGEPLKIDEVAIPSLRPTECPGGGTGRGGIAPYSTVLTNGIGGILGRGIALLAFALAFALAPDRTGSRCTDSTTSSRWGSGPGR